MLTDLHVVHSRIPLKVPYHLSFGTLDAFDTFFVIVSAQNRRGYGEITPLPGYSAESADSVRAALKTLANGTPLSEFMEARTGDAPMLVSGLMCAVETWADGRQEALSAPIATPIPLVGLVDGATQADLQGQAQALSKRGFTSFKLKAGIYSPEDEAARARAVLDVLPDDAQLSLDANQALDFERACRLCEGLAGAGVAWLEQPFKDRDWEAHEALIRAVQVPVLLDESIWTEADIVRAHDIGAVGVKLKLCKHKGLGETRNLMRLAQSLGLVLVFGNGVQTALGNHFEARLHAEAGLSTASEGNGFLKVADRQMSARLTEENGCLVDRGVVGLDAMLEAGEVIRTLQVELPD